MSRAAGSSALLGQVAGAGAFAAAAILYPVDAALFVIGTMAFGMSWMLTIPALIERLVAIDPGRRGVALIGAAQLLGSALGPLAAGLAVAGGGPQAVAWIAFASLAAGMAAFAVATKAAAHS